MGVGKIHKHINKINFLDYEKVYILVDNDRAGQDELDKLKNLCRFSFEILQFPCDCCEDFNDFYLKHLFNNNDNLSNLDNTEDLTIKGQEYKILSVTTLEPKPCVKCGCLTYVDDAICHICRPIEPPEDNYNDWCELINTCSTIDNLKKTANSIKEFEDNQSVRERLRDVYTNKLNSFKN